MQPTRKPAVRLLFVIGILVASFFVFGGCTPNAANKDLAAIKKWLNQDFSFTMSYQYMNLAINGMSQQTTQCFAADGSWSFITQRKTWDHRTDYESEEKAEFYYRYEDSQLVCYSQTDGSAPQRITIGKQEKAEMDESKAYIVGAPALLPEYLEAFSVVQTESATILTFQLPVEKVMADSTILSMFVKNIFTLAGQEYKSEYHAMIICTLETDPKTLRPRNLSYDFSQLKPYILSDGAQNGEYALDTDFVTMTYSFDYELPDTTDIPDRLIPKF